MKVFRRKFRDGEIREYGCTLVVSELIEELKKYPKDMPVLATWEGVAAYINPYNFSVELSRKGLPEEDEECLLIDVEQY